MYREDYEEDLIQNQDLKTGYTDTYNNQQYQPHYQQYNYQEDYFNEEDEYKYLEEEREEAESQQQQRQQSHDKHDMGGYGHQQLDKLDEHDDLDDGLMNGGSSSNKRHDPYQDLDDDADVLYQSDEDAAALDDNKLEDDITINKPGKKRHLTTQESISDTEFFSQRFDGPGLKSLSKQESIIEEEDITYPVTEPKTIQPVRAPTATTREVSTCPPIVNIPFAICYLPLHANTDHIICACHSWCFVWFLYQMHTTSIF